MSNQTVDNTPRKKIPVVIPNRSYVEAFDEFLRKEREKGHIILNPDMYYEIFVAGVELGRRINR